MHHRVHTVTGYYDGSQIVMDEQMKLAVGQEVIITILEGKNISKKYRFVKVCWERRKMFQSDAADYVKELRDSDRIQKR